MDFFSMNGYNEEWHIFKYWCGIAPKAQGLADKWVCRRGE